MTEEIQLAEEDRERIDRLTQTMQELVEVVESLDQRLHDNGF